MVPSIQSFVLPILVMIVVFLCAINAVESNDAGNTPRKVPGAYIVQFASSWTRQRTSGHV
jgi:hypothetical protein